MIIDDNLIQYIQQISRLRLTEAEAEQAKKDLSGILNFLDKLNELNTENTEPLSHPLGITNCFREDEVQPSYDRDIILFNAPSKTKEYIKAPKVLTE